MMVEDEFPFGIAILGAMLNFRGDNPARTNGHHGHPPEAETVTASRETAFLGAPKKGGERWSQVGLLSTKIGEGYVAYVDILYKL